MNMGTLRMDEKPLPLAIDVDAEKESPKRTKDGRLSVGQTNVRPKTADAPQLQNPTIGKSPSKNQYTLTPMPSVRSAHSRQESRSSVSSRGPNNGSVIQSPQRPSYNTSLTATPRDTPRTSVHPSVRSSILDEVEGTLSATITELQELQGNWQQEHNRTLTPDVQNRPSSTQSIRSARSSQDHGYFPAIVTEHPASRSPLPHSPLKPSPLALGPDTSVQNMQQAYHEQKKHSQAVLLENEAIKRQLDFMRDRLAAFEEEKATLSRTAKEAEENLQMILTRLGQAKVAEQAAQNEIQNAKSNLEAEKKKTATLAMDLDVEKKQSDHLQGKLDEVNVQKVELLERDLENRKEIIVTTKKLKKALEEIKTLKQQDPVSANVQNDDLKQKFDESTRRNRVLEAELRKVSAESDLPATIALMTFKLDDAQRQLSERDIMINSLRASNEHSAQRTIDAQIEKQEAASELQSLRSRVEALKAKLEAHSDGTFSSAEVIKRLTKIENELKTTRIERDQFSGLLLAEIRRTAVEDHNREHPSSAILKQRIDLADAVEITRKRAKAFLGNIGTSESQSSVADLEKEIDYYLNDIVLYKLDVKGYKKDLRKAREQIRDLSNDTGSSTVVSPT
jgi:hypothetical protein